ncbi:MAG: dihydrolipoyl dehydrogenase [Gammaproteobacteria bacterium]
MTDNVTPATENHYDVVIVGAGPAGYAAAIRCAQLGMRVACVDDRVNEQGIPVLGGSCLNEGCIPCKALLDSAAHYHRARHQFDAHGIRVGEVSLDVPAMLARKERIVQRLTDGIATLFQAHRITWIPGRGRLLTGKRVEITRRDATEEPLILSGDHVILACGSQPSVLDTVPVDGDRIVDSAGALRLPDVPRRLGVVGAGVVGLELAGIWLRLGAEVVLLDARQEFLPLADTQIAREAQKEFTRQGMDIRLGARVTGTHVADGQVTVTYQDSEGSHQLQVDRLIVAVGRSPNTDELFAPDTRLLLGEGQFILVDEYCRTNLPGVYAIGDAVRGPMLAHKGFEEGVAVAEAIAGQAAPVNYDMMPAVIYTEPAIAWIGKTEQALRAAGEEYKVGVFPFAANGWAQAMEEPAGLVKVLSHAQTDRILGVHILGAAATELIAEAVLALEYAASAEDLARTIHAHPTLSEALREAALAAEGSALHRAG